MQEPQLHSPELNDDEARVTLAELENEAVLPSDQPRRSRRKKMLMASGLLLVLLAVTGIGAYFLLRGNRVDLRANKRLAQQPANGSDIKRAAYESLSGALTEPVAGASPGMAGVNIGTGRQ